MRTKSEIITVIDAMDLTIKHASVPDAKHAAVRVKDVLRWVLGEESLFESHADLFIREMTRIKQQGMNEETET